MKDETFHTILHMAVKVHEINTACPGIGTFLSDYLGHMDRIKEKYDEWCKPKDENKSQLGEDP